MYLQQQNSGSAPFNLGKDKDYSAHFNENAALKLHKVEQFLMKEQHARQHISHFSEKLDERFEKLRNEFSQMMVQSNAMSRTSLLSSEVHSIN